MRYDTVIFDLDGTITDSGMGIMNSVKYALKKCGMEIPGEEELRAFIGPPLHEQFRRTCCISEEQAYGMVSIYREYYREKGLYENRVYDGVVEMLKKLKNAGVHILMATSKPEKFAEIIAAHFGFAQYFELIGGACMDGTRTDKHEVIEYVLSLTGRCDRSKILMIGDRSYDIDGAHRAQLHAAGVLYGYGSRRELEDAGADYIAEKPEDIAAYILEEEI